MKMLRVIDNNKHELKHKQFIAFMNDIYIHNKMNHIQPTWSVILCLLIQDLALFICIYFMNALLYRWPYVDWFDKNLPLENT